MRRVLITIAGLAIYACALKLLIWMTFEFPHLLLALCFAGVAYIIWSFSEHWK